MAAVSSSMGPINIFAFQLNFETRVFCSKLPLDNSTQLNWFYHAIIPIYVNFVYYIYSSICSTFPDLL